MMATAREIARHQLDGVKLHNLYAVKNTPLADQVARGAVSLMDRDEYIATLVDFLELLPPTTLVERISGDAPPDYFVGPAWCLDKAAVRLALAAELARRDTWQGKYFSPSPAAANLASPSLAAGSLASPSPLVGEGRGEGETTSRRNFALGGNKQ
jgi:radical SAM superfamily enzyme